MDRFLQQVDMSIAQGRERDRQQKIVSDKQKVSNEIVVHMDMMKNALKEYLTKNEDVLNRMRVTVNDMRSVTDHNQLSVFRENLLSLRRKLVDVKIDNHLFDIIYNRSSSGLEIEALDMLRAYLYSYGIDYEDEYKGKGPRISLFKTITEKSEWKKLDMSFERFKPIF